MNRAANILIIIPVLFFTAFAYPQKILADTVPDDVLVVTTTPNCLGSTCINAQKLREISCKMKDNQDVPAGHTVHFAIWPVEKAASNLSYGSSAMADYSSRRPYVKGGSKGVTFRYLNPDNNAAIPASYQWLKLASNFFMPFVPLHYECVLHNDVTDTDELKIQGNLSANADETSHITSTVTSSSCNLTSFGDALNGSCPIGSAVTVECNGTDDYTSKIFTSIWSGSSVESEAKRNTPIVFEGSGGKATKTNVGIPFFYECAAEDNNGKTGKTFNGSVSASSNNIEVTTKPACANNIVNNLCVENQKLQEISCKMKNNQDIPAGFAIHFAIWPGRTTVGGTGKTDYTYGDSDVTIRSFYTSSQKGVSFKYLDPANNRFIPPAYQLLKLKNNYFMPFVPLYYECALYDKTNKTNQQIIKGSLDVNRDEPSHVTASLDFDECLLTKGDTWVWACPANSIVDVTCTGQDNFNIITHSALVEGSASESAAKKDWNKWAGSYRGGGSPFVRSGVKVPFYFECVAENGDGKIGKTFKGSVDFAGCLTNGDINQDGVLNTGDFLFWKEEFLRGTGGISCKGADFVDLVDFNIWRHFREDSDISDCEDI